MQNTSPLVTVLMPAYNAGAYIRDAIESVLNQTYKDFEFLIINDGSTDDTAEILSQYVDPRIKVIHQENIQLVRTLNKGLSVAKGKWIARFDADDICFPDRLALQLEFLDNNPDHILVGSNAEYVDREGNYLFTFENENYTDAEIRRADFRTCPVIHSSVTYLKAAVIAAGGYDANALTFEDHLLWRKMKDHGKLANMHETLIKVRFNPESVTVDEKWRGPEFNEIKQRSIKSGTVTVNDAERIRTILKSQDFKKFKEAAYYSMIGKKYLWNQYDPNKARQHLAKAIKILPFKTEPYLLFALSFLPEAAISRIYNKIKRKE